MSKLNLTQKEWNEIFDEVFDRSEETLEILSELAENFMGGGQKYD